MGTGVSRLCSRWYDPQPVVFRGQAEAGIISRPRYRFAEFTVSPAQRVLLCEGREVPLIPRYFDLLVLLVERRHEAVHRREILDVVWNDVVVSDGALTQAVRIVRRALGDDPRSPVFIRTLSRHGYRFVYPDVVEQPDDAQPNGPSPETAPSGDPAPVDPLDEPLRVLLDPSTHRDGRRGAAETLHAQGTDRAIERLEEFRDRPGYNSARALLRDTRWDVPGAGPVPLFGRFGATRVLVGLRFRRALSLASRRLSSAVAGGALFGLIAGLFGGLLLRFGPGSAASNSVLLALPLVGLAIGAIGATGVGAGLAGAESVIRSFRSVALVIGGAIGGGAIGFVAHLIGMGIFEGLFGRDLSPLAGGFEGLAIGGAAGLGYALSTPTREGGMATPHGTARLVVVLATGFACAMAAAALGLTGSYLGAMSLDFMARSFPGSQVGLDPLARLLGETQPGTLTKTVISAFEGLMFGAGLAFGFTRRPR